MQNAVRIALVYLVFGVGWILFSDWLLDPSKTVAFPAFSAQTAKGIAFITVTAVLFGWTAYLFGRRVEQERVRYRELFKHNPQPMWVYDLETLAFLAVNNATVAKYGYTREEFLSMTIADIRPREDIPRMLESVANVRDGMQSAGVWRHRRKDGSILQVEIHSHTLTYRGRKAEMILAVDLTARLEAEAALRSSEHRFYGLAASMPFIVWTAEPDGYVDYANGAFQEFAGVYDKENPAEGWLELVHPDDRDRTMAVWIEAVRTREPYYMEFRMRHRSGEYRWLQLHAVCVEPGNGAVKWYGTASDIHAIKLAEKNASDLAKRLGKTLESITDGFFTLDRQWCFTYVNREAERILQRSRAALIGMNVWEMFPAARGSLFEREYGRAMETGRTALFEAYYPPPLDAWFTVRAYPSEQGLTVYFRDVTEDRRVRIALQESEERFRLLSKATNDVVWDWDLVNDTIWWNENFETLFGYERSDEAMGSESWSGRIHPDDAEFVERDVRRAIGSGEINWEAEYRFRKSDGTHANVLDRGYVIHDGQGRPVRMVGGMTDLSDWKRSEAEREILYAAVEQLGEMVIIASPRGLVEYVNPAYERGTGFARGEVLGARPKVARDDVRDEAFYQRLWDTVRAGETWTGQVIHQRKGGGAFVGNAVVSPVRDRDGRIVRFVGVMSDATERLKLEEQFRQSQKMEAVGRLAGGIAHDFNNMLTVILARSEKSLERLSPDDPVHANIKEVHEAAIRSAGLTRQLLAYARKQEVRPRLLDLNAVVGESLRILRRLVGENVGLAWSPAPSLWTTRIDPVQLDQVLANLCVNARDAIADVGEIRIETRNITLDADYCRTHPGFAPGDYVQIAVSDDGAGMDKETLAHLFEPFFTTKAVGKGTGLGLATVYGIIRQNNGFIHVYSEPGKGTTFRIYLPREDARASGVAASSARASDIPTGRNESVLVVEDEAMILEVAVEILKGLGYAVTAVTSPGEAIRLVEERGILVDVLVTDVVMPGMNGRELADRIRASRPGLGVLFMSGYTAQVMEHRGIVEGRDGFVQKPFSTRDIAAKLRDVLDGRSA